MDCSVDSFEDEDEAAHFYDGAATNRFNPTWLRVTVKEVPWEIQAIAAGIAVCAASLVISSLWHHIPTFEETNSAWRSRSSPHLYFGAADRFARLLVASLNAVGGLAIGTCIGALVLETIRADRASFPLFANPFYSIPSARGPRVYLPVGPNSAAAMAFLSSGWVAAAALVQAIATVLDPVEGEVRGAAAACWILVGLLGDALRRGRYWDAAPAAALALEVQRRRRVQARRGVPAAAAAAVRRLSERRATSADFLRPSQERWLRRLVESPEVGLVVDRPLLEAVASNQQAAALVKFLLLCGARKRRRGAGGVGGAGSAAAILKAELRRAEECNSPNLARALRFLIARETQAADFLET